jgi:maleylpyruvate isomerase
VGTEYPVGSDDVTLDPLALGADVDRATELFVTDVSHLDDAACRAPSALPGWSRGHVIAHVARNADSYVNLLTWARTGKETPQYASATERDDRIEAEAARPAAELLADLREAGDRFATAVHDLPAAAWSATVRYFSGQSVAAAHVVWARLREVAVHHVDLGAGFGPADWTDAFTLRLLHEVTANFARAPDGFAVAATEPPFTGRSAGSPAPQRSPARPATWPPG